jgi:hypothetical protein|tara:strand:- start:542 stop:724 length:183 start_codon:yes stop_codon:yes gene_type:complete
VWKALKAKEKVPNKFRPREALIMKEKTPNNFIARESSFKDKTFIPYDLDSFRVYHSDYQI